MNKFVTALALLGVATTAQAGSDGHPLKFDVEAETRQCLALPEIKSQALRPGARLRISGV